MSADTPQMSKNSIIEETVRYYRGRPDRFGRDSKGECVYRASETQMCAVGRCVNWEGIPSDELESRVKFSGAATHFLSRFGDGMLHDRYRGHTTSFWDSLQRLHDNENYWNLSAELSLEGYRYLIETFPDFNPGILAFGSIETEKYETAKVLVRLNRQPASST